MRCRFYSPEGHILTIVTSLQYTVHRYFSIQLFWRTVYLFLQESKMYLFSFTSKNLLYRNKHPVLCMNLINRKTHFYIQIDVKQSIPQIFVEYLYVRHQKRGHVEDVPVVETRQWCPVMKQVTLEEDQNELYLYMQSLPGGPHEICWDFLTKRFS